MNNNSKVLINQFEPIILKKNAKNALKHLGRPSSRPGGPAVGAAI